jgi:hypothetical protein
MRVSQRSKAVLIADSCAREYSLEDVADAQFRMNGSKSDTSGWLRSNLGGPDSLRRGYSGLPKRPGKRGRSALHECLHITEW